MDYIKFLDKLKKKAINGIYIFEGPEEYLAKNTINSIKNTFYHDENIREFNIFEREAADLSYKDLQDEVIRLPFMADKRLIVLKEWSNLSLELSKNYEDLEKMKDTYILVLFTSPEKPNRNLAIYKILKKYDRIVEFDMVSSPVLKNWIIRKVNDGNKTIRNDALNLFVDYLNYGNNSDFNSLYKVENEIFKLINITDNEITVDTVKLLVNKSIRVSIFDLTDAIIDRNRDKGIYELNNLFLTGEEPIKILYMISRYYQNAIKIYSYKRQNYNDYDIMRMVQLSKFEYNKIISTLKYYDLQKLSYSLNKCIEADFILKTKKMSRKFYSLSSSAILFDLFTVFIFLLVSI